MELMKHWRAATTRSSRVHKRSNRGRLGAAVAVGAVVAVAMPVLSSDAAVGGRRSIEVQTGSDLVLLEGYPRGAQVLIKAVRNGNVIGFATKRAFGGTIELNHGGRAAGDCWESPRTPNLRPGDKIQTRIIGQGIRDSSVVRGVFIESTNFAGGTLSVTGNVHLGDGRTAVRPGADVLELRVRTDGGDLREDIGADVNDATGSWSHGFAGLTEEEAASAEVVLEWSRGASGELTVAQAGVTAERLPGCPPVGP
jgi:hypothetical protein